MENENKELLEQAEKAVEKGFLNDEESKEWFNKMNERYKGNTKFKQTLEVVTEIVKNNPGVIASISLLPEDDYKIEIKHEK